MFRDVGVRIARCADAGLQVGGVNGDRDLGLKSGQRLI